MKKIILSLLVVWISFFGFSNAWFMVEDNVSYPSCWSYNLDIWEVTNPCPLDWFQSFTCWSDWRFKFVFVNKWQWSNYTQRVTDNFINCTAWQVFDSSFFQEALNDVSNPKPLSDFNWFGFRSVTGWDFSVKYFWSSDKMPVSALTPAINWLHDTVREIIPYIVYIWIWVLLAILWFYWIRRLVNRIVWKINSIFRSKRN